MRTRRNEENILGKSYGNLDQKEKHGPYTYFTRKSVVERKRGKRGKKGRGKGGN